MSDSRVNRRQFLSLAGASGVAAIAGCAEPGASTIEFDQRETASVETDDRPTADGSVYTDVYKATVDAVTLVRVRGEGGFGGPAQGEGSGFLHPGGYIVTNDHVVFSSEDVDVQVQYNSGEWTGGDVIGTDFYSDLAVIEPDTVPENVAPLALSDERPVVGQEVLAIGNPIGLEGSMSQGIVSGVNRSVSPAWHDFSYPNVVQTDAAVNPGNSGGPLVGMNGEVVGVVHATQGENIGYAISAALSERVIPALINHGEFRHSHMGIRLIPVDLTIAQANDLEEATGIFVAAVSDGGPADGTLEGSTDTTGGGVPVGGDIIRSIDGEPIPDNHALSTFLALQTDPGDTISLTVIRDGSETTVEMTLGERPEPGF
ncbi:S1C family serine protease [Natronosalvus amylolyticus]|uniref:S1C family serine protease n=1 Tax=Natronosalvus amylolyticus TaxID=2961994 RepID=UPI0020C9C561|nr:trypsin-like peptidase domain-containing protein [Natronosalvus amylolyticus]